jgi:uncharacterized protein (TIGR02145 family)
LYVEKIHKQSTLSAMKTKLFLLSVLATATLVACGDKNPGDDTPPPVRKYTLTVDAATAGEITMTVDGEDVPGDDTGKIVASVPLGADVMLTAEESAGSLFSKWVSTNITLADPTKNPATFKMSAGNVSVRAEFTIDYSYDPGVVIDGKKWATRNVARPGTFAATTGDHGMLYQWGQRLGWTNTVPITNSNGGGMSEMIYVDQTNAPDVDAWPVENDPCPTGWRLPTRDEMMFFNKDHELSGEMTWEPVDLQSDGTFTGLKFTDTATGNTIFFPTAGVLLGFGEIMGVGDSGSYWTATPDSSTVSIKACYMSFYDDFYSNSNNQGFGGKFVEVADAMDNAHSVRCISTE